MGKMKVKDTKSDKGNVPGGVKKQNNLIKRSLVYFLSAVALVIVAWLGFKLFGNNYKSNAMEMKTNTIVAERVALIILNDYQENMIRVETEHSAKNAEGMDVATDDIQQVIKWRQEFFKKNGTTGLLENLVSKINECYSNMKLTPARYRDTQENFKSALDGINQLVKLTTTPDDSVVVLSEKINKVRTSIQQSLEPTDFNFFVSMDQIKELTDQLTGAITDKNIAEAITMDASSKPNSALNKLKYKKMGFAELPNGKGVLYREVTKGKGPKPKDDTNIKLNYEGKLMDGTVFDSSYERGEAVSMRPSQTVPGFWHSLTCMQAGSKWEIFIPYDQAYGERAAGSVKPYSDLFFTIEIIELEN